MVDRRFPFQREVVRQEERPVRLEARLPHASLRDRAILEVHACHMTADFLRGGEEGQRGLPRPRSELENPPEPAVHRRLVEGGEVRVDVRARDERLLRRAQLRPRWQGAKHRLDEFGELHDPVASGAKHEGREGGREPAGPGGACRFAEPRRHHHTDPSEAVPAMPRGLLFLSEVRGAVFSHDEDLPLRQAPDCREDGGVAPD